MKTLRKIVPLVLLVLVASSCQLIVKANPVHGRTAMTGDSIGLQAMLYGSSGTPAAQWDTAEKIGLGWKASNAQPRVTADVAGDTTSPETLVVEFGHNYGYGFTQADKQSVLSMLFSPADSACVVAVLPVAGANLSQTHRDAIAQYRELVSQVALVRSNTVLVDWGEIVAEHPEYVDEDGVHLKTTQTTPAQDLEYAATGQVAPVYEDAARAFIGMIEDGVAQCP